jgi:hypothetical protein
MKPLLRLLLDIAVDSKVYLGLICLWLIVTAGALENAFLGATSWEFFFYLLVGGILFFGLIPLKSAEVRFALKFHFLYRPHLPRSLAITKRKPL